MKKPIFTNNIKIINEPALQNCHFFHHKNEEFDIAIGNLISTAMLNRKDHTGHNGCNTNPNRIVSRTAHAMSTANEHVGGKCSLPYKCNY